ncbi:LysR family transcriptional regulator [Cupriavidus basilensis]|uniref:LysR family transcriptional regulator n=1 Tax=Cupriavidus basilensis TaxID=68895 RepID=UPI000750E90D|nr:LysR family transcriptional regulator [Cupriavidus basilensis]
MAINIKYRPIKAFLLAVETGSFTHAADRLGVTQPSFTALIRDLEDVLEVRLFERTTRKIELTTAGREFLARVRRPLTDLEEAYRSVSELAAVKRGSIVLGALPSTSLTLIPPALAALSAARPSLGVRVLEAHNDELLEMLRTNQIEFALATMLEPTSDLTFQPLLADSFYAVFPAQHALSRRPAVYWRDLEQYDLILLSQGSSVRQQFDRAVSASAAASTTHSRYDVTHMTTATGLVRRGVGITVLPRLALPELNMDGLQSKPLQEASARRTIGLLHRRDRSLSPAAEAFASQLRAVIADVEKTLPPLEAVSR